MIGHGSIGTRCGMASKVLADAEIKEQPFKPSKIRASIEIKSYHEDGYA